VLEKTYTKEQILEQIEPAMAIEVKSFYDKLIAEGFEKGTEQGIEQEKTNTIHRMKDQNFSAAQIAAAVDLPEETVKQILNR
ncbi:MAG: hypothetical protein NWR67_02700, partial [Saprospiraceae bacterium]|nr:hypothetical protein [Saprospiraceae bacterium]